MRISCGVVITAFLLVVATPSLLAQSSNLAMEIKDAQTFLAGLYGTKDTEAVETQARARVQVGDPVSKHRALLGQAMNASYNPYSDRFVLKYYQDGKQQDPGGQGYWVLTIEVDAKHTIAQIRVGIARH